MTRGHPQACVNVHGGRDAGARELCEGQYVEDGLNHGKATFRKVDGHAGWIYFWEDEDDVENIGWWMSSEVGSDQVWAFHPSKTASRPPTSGWKAPFDGPVDMSFVLSYEDQPSTASSSGVSRDENRLELGIAPGDTTHVNEDFCQVCQKAGKLLLCERCPRAFHVHCIERLMELDEEDLVAQRRWECPICLHGEGVLQGSTGPQYSEAQMQELMQKATSAANRHRRLSQRRRDLFLHMNFELIGPFVSNIARTRILKASDDHAKLPLLAIGSKVRAVGMNGRDSYEAHILNQTGHTRYLVVNVETGVEAEVERHMMAAIDTSDQGEPSFDFYANAHANVLSERAKLKDYQMRGVNWLIHAALNRGGGILADDMGLGKTVQTLACLSWLRSSANFISPFCVVCPLSCAGNWIRECKRFVPHLSVAKVCGGAEEQKASLDNDEIWYGMKDIIVTTYETIRGMEDFFQRHVWSVLVLDEAHRIKSQFTQSRLALDTIPCASRLLLTGTPLQNNLSELYELLRFLWPDVLAKESEVFQGAVQIGDVFSEANRAGKTDAIPEVSPNTVVNSGLVEKVRSLLATLMLRRKKVDVITLPPKIARDVWLPLTPAQVSWYRRLMACRFEDKNKLGIRDAFTLITRLRLTCAHPRCILSTEANKEKLQKYANIDMEALQALADADMSEQVIQGSAKLCFLDKLFSHLHAQNMGMNREWRQQFEDRQARAQKHYRKRSASQWLKSSEGILFLDEMRPWRPTRNVGARFRAAQPIAEAGFCAAIGADAPCPSSSSKASPDSEKTTRSASEPVAHANGATTSKNESQGYDSDGEEDTPRPHKILIFSQYHMCLDLLEKFCSFRGWRTFRLDGGTSRVVRELDMRDFNNDDEDYFIYLIGTRAGGLGINLHYANHVVLFDHDWNPHVDSQAIDRAHRIGQHRTVNIYRLIQEWSVEEKLVHRQEVKLKMEKCVISSNATDEDPGFDVKERLSADEVLEMLRHGEATLKRFPGELLDQKPLQEFLDRPRRPLLELDADFERQSELHPDEDFVEDDETIRTGRQDDIEYAERQVATSPNISSDKVVPQQAPEPEPTRSRSGRIIRPVVQFYPQLYEPMEKKKPKKPLLKHDRVCFVCGEFAKEHPSIRGEQEEPELECGQCPKVYHPSCVGVGSEAQKRRWTCGWHRCKRCGRGPSSCGGMLMHCQWCPSALCYDCFPPNFRRVTPDQKFWADLQKKNWNMSPQKMMLFQCNSCLALAEQRKRQLMREEDLAAQADARKRQALEEKRNWAEKKRKRENEEARRRLRQVMAEHERAALQDGLKAAQEKVRQGFEQLGPQEMTNGIKCKYLQKALCASCGFPGHKQLQCPFPKEKIADGRSTASTTKGVVIISDSTVHVEDIGQNVQKSKSSHGTYKCPICSNSNHGRLQCPNMNREHRDEYGNRMKLLNEFADQLGEVKILKELGMSLDLTQGLSQDVEIRLQTQVHDILRRMGLPHLILEPLLSAPVTKASAPRVDAPKPKVKAMPKMKVKSFAAAKAIPMSNGKSKGKRKPDGKNYVKAAMPSEVAWQVADGLAWGWELRGNVNSQGNKFLTYRRPGETKFLTAKEAFVDVDPGTYEAVKAERVQVLRELDLLVQKEPRAAKTLSKTQPREQRLAAKPLLASGGNTTARPGAQQNPDAIVPGYVHTYYFPSGPAMNWVMRIKVTNNGALAYTYRRPDGNRWELPQEVFKEVGERVQSELLSVRDIQSKHIRSKLAMSSRGVAIAASLKRKKTESGALQEEKRSRQKRVQALQKEKRSKKEHVRVCDCGAKNAMAANFCNRCGKSFTKAFNGHGNGGQILIDAIEGISGPYEGSPISPVSLTERLAETNPLPMPTSPLSSPGTPPASAPGTPKLD